MQKEQLNHNEDLRVHHLDLQDYKLISILRHIFSVKIFTVSRIPQIIQNFKQRKVIDLSPYYFIFQLAREPTACPMVIGYHNFII